ncbi:MAG: leucyl/phenylalanyl-tRNA--protein transferase [Gammaproteobacteria bacterium]|nr:leucyl/phenylalanyl-tRNA--protein transferase [Gammaproteobacteria bacterium]MBT8111016.1 leucyl/phenylalanyl-tRNA--protein transferase [Gammaproteobacteria bacterium]NND48452.1 leucyl/phenylalanyl-tRNA--protein transferase [Woeseiaceae bacterium]NNL45714.1 leucyl/phenylalanyl-tRNA--protein transferase [Woeseiaceae bacterium]
MSNNRVIWLSPTDPQEAFPPVEAALREPNGLLAAGGDLGTERLLSAYRSGIFPWSDEGQPILWWSPDPRCAFSKGDFHLSRSLRRHVRRSTAEVRFNTSFLAVIRACAAPRASEKETWITADMIAAYVRLHGEGWAHSVEIWREGSLVGGLYGLAIGRAFFGESMYSAEANTSKIALLALSNMINNDVFGIFDCQLPSSHLLSLGAKLIPRREFIEVLKPLCNPVTPFENWPSAPISAAELLPA